MIKTARQLKDLIRNLSRKKSADAQLLMRNYMMERFLERISLSEYRWSGCPFHDGFGRYCKRSQCQCGGHREFDFRYCECPA